jgi:signal transduction histidine kinase
MTDLIDSLRELSYQRNAISPTRTRIDLVLRRAIEALHARPEFRNSNICLLAAENLEGMFDSKKLERVFFNLILNACEASQGLDAAVTITAKSTDQDFEIRIRDGGRGIPEYIRDTLFDPFVSYGKPNGTGLGLAIVSKIVQDHSGSVSIEQTSERGTTVLVRLPLSHQPATKGVQSAFT